MKKIYTEKKRNLRVLSPSFGGKKKKKEIPRLLCWVPVVRKQYRRMLKSFHFHILFIAQFGQTFVMEDHPFDYTTKLEREKH